MALNLTLDSPYKPLPGLDKKEKDHIARKAGKKNVKGTLYKNRTSWKKVCDFIGASKGVSITGKAFFESKHYVQAAIVRKSHAEENNRPQASTDNTPPKASSFWDSKGVQRRLMRQDFIRYNASHFADETVSARNKCAHRWSRVAHAFHGLCEICAAPTSTCFNGTRNTVATGTDEKSTKNKLFMVGLLGFIGIGTTELMGVAREGVVSLGAAIGQTLLTTLIAFPAASSAMGLFGSIAGMVSQTMAEKQTLSEKQKANLTTGLTKNMQKLLFRLKSIKAAGNSIALTALVAKAMQGRHHLTKKISENDLEDGIPKLLNQVLNAIDLNKTEQENIRAMTNAMGEYMQVSNKPDPKTASPWARYQYAKAVTTKESHFVALMSLVDHMDIADLNENEVRDLKRQIEDVCAPNLHDFVLKTVAIPASLIDAAAKTQIAPTLRKWASPAYRKRQALKIADPSRASRNSFKGEYMAKNIHQYGPVTRSLIKLAEGMRLVNLHLVLASNSNLSRIFNNLALTIQGTLSTGPASRLLCGSIGRFFGGALLAFIFGTLVPVAADATGHPSEFDVNVGGDSTVRLSMTSIGILMFILATPTLMVQGLAELVARVEGWDGSMTKQLRSDSGPSFAWN